MDKPGRPRLVNTHKILTHVSEPPRKILEAPAPLVRESVATGPVRNSIMPPLTRKERIRRNSLALNILAILFFVGIVGFFYKYYFERKEEDSQRH